MKDLRGVEVKPGDFVVFATNDGQPYFAKVLEIREKSFKVATERWTLGGDLIRTSLKIWYRSRIYPTAMQAIRINPEGVPADAMAVLDKEKPQPLPLYDM